MVACHIKKKKHQKLKKLNEVGKTKYVKTEVQFFLEIIMFNKTNVSLPWLTTYSS